ncbi:HEPN domain-containing protein [Sphingobacterium multivorum]|uniref:HEPN domain-containing protein n=1 Tax=Sphingobacterium multivorum TaxID=28454 RepID=UPI003DA32E7F
MNNKEANEHIDSCISELDSIKNLIEGLGHTSKPVPYLTKYSLIKSCGTIELAFKTIVADVHINQSYQIKNYINKTLRNSSLNPSFENICKILKNFDDEWNDKFKKELKLHSDYVRITDSLRSLNNARNTFAHGSQVTLTFENVYNYFNDSVEIIKILDKVLK